MKKDVYLLGEAARECGAKPYQVAYAITSGLVPDVTLRIGGKRIFRAADIKRLREHFGKTQNRRRKNGA